MHLACQLAFSVNKKLILKQHKTNSLNFLGAFALWRI